MEDRSLYLKQRIIAIYIELMRNGTPKQKIHVYSEVARLLIAEHKVVNRGFVRRIVLKFKSTGSVHRMNGGGRPNILSSNPNVNAIIENAMVNNDETTAADLLTLLQEGGYDASIPTINRIRRKLGWTLKGTRYCQLIRENNKPKRFDWAILNQNEQFDDVIWSDETSVPLEQYKRTCYRKKGTNFSKKPKPKHPLKVHVWAGISKKGKTKVCIFSGIMDAQMYVKILEDTLLPFIHEKYPEGHRFMQDNDPKHTSRLAKCFMQEKNINWWKTPAGKMLYTFHGISSINETKNLI